MSADRFLAPAGAPPHAVRLLVEIPYRRAGLIALCALAGFVATLASAPPRAPARAAATRVVAQAQRPRFTPVGDAVRLQMDLDPGHAPGRADAAPGPAASAPLPSARASLRLDDPRTLEALVAEMRAAPAAAGRATSAVAGHVARGAEPAAWRGLLAGLLLGLSAAGLLELRGGRMRSPREAAWALGVPVLGAIPTLSARARAASVGRAAAAL